MKKVKITVLRKMFNEDLAKEYGAAGLRPCPMLREGQVFYADYAKPDGFCDEAWKAIYQYVFALAHGATKEPFYYGDWISKPGMAICSCNDGLRPVIFKLDATDEEVIAAAKAVNAHDFIMKMEKGYDTELKEHGAGLSIGQRQLIAFARTMVSMPKILILDEATSSIDTHTEILVQRGIEALLAGRTSFVIAHRLSTIQNADRIFVIDKGGILEQGSPAELMEKKGAYYKLYMAQFAELG